MSKFILSKAMGNIPDDMLREAMEIKKATGRKWIIRAAACLVLVIGLLFTTMREDNGIVTAPGILTITAYAENQTPVTITTPDAVRHGKFGLASPLLGNPFCNAFMFSVPDEHNDGQDIRFLLSFEGGVFLKRDEEDKFVSGEVSVGNHSTVYWTMEEAIAVPGSVEHRTTAYVDILVYEGEQIIGYAVLRLQAMTCAELAETVGKKVAHEEEWPDVDPQDYIYCDGGDHKSSTYSIEMLASVLYPKVDGKYQQITGKYVTDRIEEVKKK